MAPQQATSKTTSLAFNIHRREPELICPAKPTPCELKILSGIDHQDFIRCHLRMIFFFRHNPLTKGNGNNNHSDPVEVIRKALAETLVYYHPFAGRLREGPDGSLSVDCNGRGALFVEADAEMALDEFGDLCPPFPCLEELLFHDEGPRGFLHSPLLLLQVTRLKCGSFILAFSFNHAICDGAGLGIFLRTLGELANGANVPSIPPVWDRHLLGAWVPPHAHEDVHVASDTTPHHESVVQRSFFFGSTEISAIRRLVPSDLHGRITTFELLVSFLWRCRTLALRLPPDAESRLMIAVNARPLFRNRPLPLGYYGNAVVFPVAIATARELSEQPLVYAIRLLQDAKSSVTEEYVWSVAGGLGTRGRKHQTMSETFFVSDARHLGLDQVDLGWGQPVYGGAAGDGLGGFDGASWLVRWKNKNGETGIIVPVLLPEPATERFAEQLALVFNNDGCSKPLRPSL
ncbi:PREDICTED: (Z)-3-hexen-1-ol acetyltransferase-like [Tarenaya hassleriana]|uniref:(Z)-3-hexen-1-ol acetyltransferase-like n=1 Tax=Tarenaya hassleriana TaxID=28532 RepID=UPI00053C2077|nr:PREDICTED: (Z)-3-hexen-1-ol acetyltransferase-like [Tarenaya hassleriana]